MNPLNENKMNIECQWMKSKRLLINPDGQVLPCCYFANVIYMLTKFSNDDMKAKPRDERGVEDQIMDKGLVALETNSEPLFQEYLKNKEKYNINNTDLEEIINSDWFVKDLPESWNNEKRVVRQCKKYCTKNDL